MLGWETLAQARVLVVGAPCTSRIFLQRNFCHLRTLGSRAPGDKERGSWDSDFLFALTISTHTRGKGRGRPFPLMSQHSFWKDERKKRRRTGANTDHSSFTPGTCNLGVFTHVSNGSSVHAGGYLLMNNNPRGGDGVCHFVL